MEGIVAQDSEGGKGRDLKPAPKLVAVKRRNTVNLGTAAHEEDREEHPAKRAKSNVVEPRALTFQELADMQSWQSWQSWQPDRYLEKATAAVETNEGKAAMKAPTPNAGTSDVANYRGVYPSQRYIDEFYAQLKVNNVNVTLGKSDDKTKLALIRDYVIRECNLTNARNFDDATPLPREYLEEATAAVVKTKQHQESGNVPPYQNDHETMAKGKAAMRSEDAAPTPNAGTSDAAKYRGVYKYPNSQDFYAQLCLNNKGYNIGFSKDTTKLALIRDYVIR
ncbi:W2 domain-containing protein, partial [Pycnococcus provasolii]